MGNKIKKMLSRNIFRASNFMRSSALLNAKINPRFLQKGFSTNVGITDMPDVFKVNYTEEFDQGLTQE